MLREIFDHGCDSLSQSESEFTNIWVELLYLSSFDSFLVFVTLTACLSLQLGDDPKLILLVSVWLYSLFYAAHWQTFASGVMSFSSFDVTEGQMVVISICVASGISSLFGWDLWRKSFLGGVQLNWIVLAISAFLGVSQMWKIATSLANAYRKRPNRAIFKPAIPLLIATIPAAMALYGFNAEFQRRNLVIICLTLGLLSSKVTNNLIVSKV